MFEPYHLTDGVAQMAAAKRFRDLDPVTSRQASLDVLADVLWIATERLLDVMRSSDIGLNDVDAAEASIGPEGVKQIKDGWHTTMLTLARRAPDELWRTADQRIEVHDLSRRDVAIARVFELYVLLCDNLHWLASPDVVLDIVGDDWTVFVEENATRIPDLRGQAQACCTPPAGWGHMRTETPRRAR